MSEVRVVVVSAADVVEDADCPAHGLVVKVPAIVSAPAIVRSLVNGAIRIIR